MEAAQALGMAAFPLYWAAWNETVPGMAGFGWRWVLGFRVGGGAV
jgi:hypothetical protein